MTNSSIVQRRESVPISDITIPKGRRHVDEAKVKSLAKSIDRINLLQAIGLTKDYVLVFGLHRLKAVESLGTKTINCIIMDADDLLCELAKIDENAERTPPDALEWARMMKRRKEIYEAIHADAVKHGGDRVRAKPQDAVLLPSFSEDAAEKHGVSVDTIQRAVQIATDITPDVQERIADLPISDNKAELLRLSKLSDAEQKKAAAKLASGKAKTVREAAPPKPKPARGQPVIDVRRFTKVKANVGKLVREMSDLKEHAGGAKYHSIIREHLNGILETLSEWQKVALK